jgi:outer membrane protein insertion porin family
VPGAPDQVDLTVTVEEKPTGSLQLGRLLQRREAGAGFGIKQENAFGTGNYLGVDVNTSKYNRTSPVNTTDPYFTQDGISRTIDLYHRTPSRTRRRAATTRWSPPALGMRFGIPFSEFDTVFFGASIERTEIKPGTNIPAAYLAYAEQDSATPAPRCRFTVGWARDTATARWRPPAAAAAPQRRAGRDRRQPLLARQLPVPAVRAAQQAVHRRLQRRTGLGQGPPASRSRCSRTSTRAASARCAASSRARWARATSPARSIGGTRKVTLNAELYTPFPGAGNDRTLRLFGFVDVGNVYGENDRFA